MYGTTNALATADLAVEALEPVVAPLAITFTLFGVKFTLDISLKIG